MKRKSVLVLACLALVLGIGTAAAWGSQVSLQQTHNYLLYYPTTHTTDWGYANVWYVGEARHHPEESALFGSSMSFNIPQITQGLSHLDASPQTWQKRVYTMTRVTYLTEAFMLFNFGQDVTGHGPEPASPGYIKQSVENEGGFAFQPQAAGLHLMALVGIYDLSFALEQDQGSP